MRLSLYNFYIFYVPVHNGVTIFMSMIFYVHTSISNESFVMKIYRATCALNFGVKLKMLYAKTDCTQTAPLLYLQVTLDATI